MQQSTVVEYVVNRIAKLGITDCFGIPGDFAFPIDDAIASSKSVKWRGCANELNAAYAADGYARLRGASMLCTTYAVGELSALNGVMGAEAERSTVFHVVGMPSMALQSSHKVIHHSLGDGVFQNFINIGAQAACAHAILTPENCTYELERVIAVALAHRQPAYIVVAEDTAIRQVTSSAVAPYPEPASHPETLKADEVKAKGHSHLLTACPGCAMNLTDANYAAGLPLQATHPVVELYQRWLRPQLST